MSFRARKSTGKYKAGQFVSAKYAARYPHLVREERATVQGAEEEEEEEEWDEFGDWEYYEIEVGLDYTGE